MEPAVTSNDIADQDDKLASILSSIVAAYDPVEVWLFGSRFRGDVHVASDWDLLVLVHDDADDALFDPYLAWETAQGCGIPVDIVVETVGDFNRSVSVATSLAREIKNERRILFRKS